MCRSLKLSVSAVSDHVTRSPFRTRALPDEETDLPAPRKLPLRVHHATLGADLADSLESSPDHGLRWIHRQADPHSRQQHPRRWRISRGTDGWERRGKSEHEDMHPQGPARLLTCTRTGQARIRLCQPHVRIRDEIILGDGTGPGKDGIIIPRLPRDWAAAVQLIQDQYGCVNVSVAIPQEL